MNNKYTAQNLRQLDGKITVAQAIPFGLQHILAMFVANIAPLLIVAGACELDAASTAKLIQSAMIVAGIGTMLQIYPIGRIGSGLPIVLGLSFTFVAALCYIGPAYGYGVVVGAVIVGGIVEMVLGLFAKYWLGFISPIVAASVVTAIGFSLLPVGATSFGGGSGSADFGSSENLILGTITLVCCLGFNIVAKSFWKQLSVLFGLIVGYIAACFMGVVDFSALDSVGIIALPEVLPFKPEFHLNAILTVIVIYLVSMTEGIGDTSALASTGLNRPATVKELSGSLACDGFTSVLSGLLGSLPITSFSQNVGLVSMTKVVNRFAVFTGAVIMLLAGFFPIIGAILATLPDAVLGGCTLMMYGTIVVSGMQMIEKASFSQRNITIVALSLSAGLGFTQVPEIFAVFPAIIQTIFAENCVAVVFIVSVVLNLVLPGDLELD